MIRIIVISLLFFLTFEMNAQQQTQYSQYIYSLFSINPAYAGNKDYVQSLLTERRQWTQINGSPHNQSLTIHAPLNRQKMGIGLTILNESIGARANTGGMLSYSYSIKTKKSRLSFGLKAGMYSYRLSQNGVSYRDLQDVNAISNIPKNFTPFFDGGVHYYIGSFQAGLVVSNLTESRVKLSNSNIYNAILNRHVMTYFEYNFFKKGKWNYRPSILVKYVKNAPLSFDLNSSFIYNRKLLFGFSYRSSGSIIFMTQAYLTPNLRLGYSFDYALRYSSVGGSHEIVLGLDLKKDKKTLLNPRYF